MQHFLALSDQIDLLLVMIYGSFCWFFRKYETLSFVYPISDSFFLNEICSVVEKRPMGGYGRGHGSGHRQIPGRSTVDNPRNRGSSNYSLVTQTSFVFISPRSYILFVNRWISQNPILHISCTSLFFLSIYLSFFLNHNRFKC